MLGAVAERRAEIGVFRAIGFRQTHIVRVILAEATALSVVAVCWDGLAVWWQ